MAEPPKTNEEARDIALKILIALGRPEGSQGLAAHSLLRQSEREGKKAAVIAALNDPKIFDDPALKETSGLDLDGWNWLAERGVKIGPTPAILQKMAVGESIFGMKVDKLFYTKEGDSKWYVKKTDPTGANPPTEVAVDDKVKHLIQAEIIRRTKDVKDTQKAAEIRDQLIKQAKDQGWLTKSYDELANGDLKDAAASVAEGEARRVAAAETAKKTVEPNAVAFLDLLTADPKTPKPFAGDMYAGFGGQIILGDEAKKRNGNESLLHIDVGEKLKKPGNEKDAAAVRRLATDSVIEVMRAANAAKAITLTGDIPAKPAETDDASLAAYDKRVTDFLIANQEALKMMQDKKLIENGKLNYKALTDAGVVVKKGPDAAAATPLDSVIRLQKFRQLMVDLTDGDAGNDQGKLLTALKEGVITAKQLAASLGVKEEELAAKLKEKGAKLVSTAASSDEAAIKFTEGLKVAPPEGLTKEQADQLIADAMSSLKTKVAGPGQATTEEARKASQAGLASADAALKLAAEKTKAMGVGRG